MLRPWLIASGIAFFGTVPAFAQDATTNRLLQQLCLPEVHEFRSGTEPESTPDERAQQMNMTIENSMWGTVYKLQMPNGAYAVMVETSECAIFPPVSVQYSDIGYSIDDSLDSNWDFGMEGDILGWNIGSGQGNGDEFSRVSISKRAVNDPALQNEWFILVEWGYEADILGR
jgi:hypothetical protein